MKTLGAIQQSVENNITDADAGDDGLLVASGGEAIAIFRFTAAEEGLGKDVWK